MTDAPSDPGKFFRDMLGQWETVTNQLGGELMKSGEFARALQGANSASMKAQSAMNQVMERALAAANLPSRADIEDLSARLRGVRKAWRGSRLC